MRKFWSTLYRFKVHHVVLWAAYFAFWIIYYAKFYQSLWSLTLIVGVYFIFHSVPFYITSYYLFPQFLYKRRNGMFVLLLLSLIVLASLGLAIALYYMLAPYAPEVVSNPTNVFQIAMLSIFMMVGALCAVKLTLDKLRSDKVNQQLDKQRLESELQYLKAQVNPHFLFNAINSVYFLIKKDPDVAAETLIRLSDLLRFQLYDCSDERIPIEKELEYLHNFVALEKIRKGGKVKVSFEVAEETSGFAIAPFMVIPFLENAFKHVSTFSDKENFIHIHLSKNGSLFKATLRNTSDNLVRYEVGGIGLKNVKRRLDLLYPNKHTLAIKEEAGIFLADLTLQTE